MKKIFLSLILSVFLVSCSISEHIQFNQDGSGKLAYEINMSKMFEITKDLDQESSKKIAKDIVEGTKKDMDSVITFKEIYEKAKSSGKTLTAKQLEEFKQMEAYKMHIIVNKAKNEFKYIISSDFKNITEVGNVGSVLSAVKESSGKKNSALDVANADGSSEVKFTFEKNKFTRVVEKKAIEEEAVYEEIVDSSAVESYDEELQDSIAPLEGDAEVENVEEEKEMSEKDMKKMEAEFKKMGEMMEKGLKESAFLFQYTFPNKIKKVSLPKSDYKLSEDKKSIYINYSLEEFTKKIKDLNLNIEFE